MKNLITKKARSRRYDAIILVTALGVLLTLVISAAVYNWESELAERAFIDLARDQAQALSGDLNDGTDALYTLRDYIETAGHAVGRSEYQAFAKRVREHYPGLRNAAFLANVAGHERSTFEQTVRAEGFPEFHIVERNAEGKNVIAKVRSNYYPVLYPEPVENTPQVLGVNAGADPLRRDAIERAVATGRAAGTEPLNLLISEKKLSGFQTFIPVYRYERNSSGTSRQLQGLIVGVFDIGPMIESILATTARPAGLDIYFYNPDGMQGQRLIYWHSSENHPGLTTIPTESELLLRMHWTTAFNIADRTWGAIFVSSAPTNTTLAHWQAIAALVIGLTMTATMVAYLLTSLRHTIRLELLAYDLHQTTENLRAESRKARHAEEQVRAVTDNLPMLITYSDSERRYRFVNKTGEEWYAKPAKDILGKTVQEVTGHPSTIETPLLFEKLSHGPMRYERTNIHPDGKTRIVDVVNIPDFSSDREVQGFYSIATDITERKANEEKFQQIQKLESIGKLTGGVAHDVNNMLAVISGNLELACEDIEHGIDVRKKLQTALRATERGSTLTQSLLSFARQQPLAPRSLNLNEIASDVVDFSRRTLTKNIDVKLVCAEDLWHCDADPGQMQNALLNLIVNARDAMPDGGELTIETGNIHFDPIDTALADVEPGDYVMLTVSDTGTGMPPEILSRVFEPFFTTKNASEGTGLGLSMVYGFVKQSNGHAKIYSEVGHGTSVRIYLPRNADSLQNSPIKTLPSQAHGEGETILVVEDNPDVRTLVCSLLRSLNYRVLDAGNTDEGLDYVRERSDIDMLLSDVMLPGAINGPQLAEEARRIRPTLKILFMSGYTENALTHNGRLADGVQLLHKPFSKDSLARKVHEIFDLEAANE